VHDAHYVFGDLKTWGWITLTFGIVELIAAFSLFAGNPFGWYFGIAVGALAALGALFELPAYPFWSLAVFTLSLWIIHGLAMYGGRADMSAAETGAGPTMTSQGPRPPM
jgi:hypothetical protein